MLQTIAIDLIHLVNQLANLPDVPLQFQSPTIQSGR